jgi:hypothetical protein
MVVLIKNIDQNVSVILSIQKQKRLNLLEIKAS